MVSIEIGHRYADADISEEQIKGISIFKSIEKKLVNENYSVKILIDDLHINENIFNEVEYIDFFNKNGVKIDILDYEKSFISCADKVMTFFDKNKLKLESFRKENKKVLFYSVDNKKIPIKIIYKDREKYTCIMLSFAWQLCRLGVIDKWNNYNKANSIINILPEKYKKIEDSVYLLHLDNHNFMVKNIFY